MLSNLQNNLQKFLQTSISEAYPSNDQVPTVELEVPADKSHGEYSSNVALKSAKILQKSPLDIAADLQKLIESKICDSDLKDHIDRIEVKKPGFINFYLKSESISSAVADILSQGDDFGRSQAGKGQKIQIEFVSANPTGTLSIAHARQAAVGDALGNILNFVGCEADKEYYVNDEGNQINLLGESVLIRAEALLKNVEVADDAFGDDHYRGEYVIDIARDYIEANSIDNISQLPESGKLAEFAVDCLMKLIKQDLDDFGVHFDNWAHQSKIATEKSIVDIIAYLKSESHVYEKDGAVWFETTKFGDDKDRVLKKTDGTYTYLTPDIVYHKDKFERGYKRILNIWGPDHHGYIARIKASAEALGYHRDDIEVLIVQLATIYKQGKAVSMSTRKGQYISLREVIDEVGSDAARYFFLMRHINVHLDFDLELAKKQTSENPVYYIQYAHARVHSINKKAIESNLTAESHNFNLLNEVEELDLIKKCTNFPEILILCYNQLDPYALVNYLHELATLFHKFYDKHKVIIEDQSVSAQRLALVNAACIVLANGLKLLGLSAPKEM